MSILHSLYFACKPFLPIQFRYTVRRFRAKQRLRASKDWPIMPSAATPPPQWNGWPDGKQFALVLTHDVEGRVGWERCGRLASLEARLGFRSSFNFVPEGEYLPKAKCRDRLVADGFEVGVHDLRHDGSLYRSRNDFIASAQSINRYLRDWGAVGFRAGFMFHNLAWLQELDIEYDASTFDTDPFEPQPEGVGTIFPFWVRGTRQAGGKEGYVELPYTLPQDSTMFLILREKTIDLWKRKLDWIAAKGGMALLNVHPDYVDLDRHTTGASEFDPAFYRGFLEYVKDKYAGAYWHALPHEIARFYRKTRLGLA